VGSRWTEEEKNFIRKQYTGKNARNLSEILGRSTSSIYHFVSSNKLAVETPWSPTEDLILLNNPDLTAKQLVALLDRSRVGIKHRRKALGMRFERRGNKKYSLNHSYFAKPNLENSYWAGFIAADGNICKTTPMLRIGLSIRDEEHLYQFKKNLDFTGPVIRVDRKSGYEGQPTCIIHIYSRQIKTDLYNVFGIIPNKTFTLKPPSLNDIDLLDSYIIGYIDGDGSIFKSNGYLHLSITGNQYMLEMIRHRFDSLCLPRKGLPAKLHKSRGVFGYSVGGYRADFIYHHFLQMHTPKLSRKWNHLIEGVRNEQV
jgi:hypothetical protein